MKIRIALTASLLAVTMSCLADETNPFENQRTTRPPPPASGESFVTLKEHILVPADQLDAWLEKHPLTPDASGLRATAQTWISEGTARLDHTALSAGTVGRNYANDSAWELTYASEYQPPNPEEWPAPTAFYTRNLGYDVSGSAGIEQGAMVLRARMGFCGMLPHHAWNELAERTRQPDDVFIPRFRSIQVERQKQDAAGNRVSADPFAEPSPKPAGSSELRFEPAKTYLASRADDDLPEKTAPLIPNRLVRLIFFRGTILASPAEAAEQPSEIHHLSANLIRVNHKQFSDWVQANSLSKIPDLAWEATGGWLKSGTAQAITTLTAPNQSGSSIKIEDQQEVIYPTEWEPGKRPPVIGDKPSQLEFSHAAAVDTRNVGTELQAEVVSNPEGSNLKFKLRRTAEGGKSVHHRIFRDGEWKANMTFPIFSSNSWQSEIKIKRGVWMLVGSGSDIDSKGKLDPAHSVLAFIRLD